MIQLRRFVHASFTAPCHPVFCCRRRCLGDCCRINLTNKPIVGAAVGVRPCHSAPSGKSCFNSHQHSDPARLHPPRQSQAVASVKAASISKGTPPPTRYAHSCTKWQHGAGVSAVMLAYGRLSAHVGLSLKTFGACRLRLILLRASSWWGVCCRMRYRRRLRRRDGHCGWRAVARAWRDSCTRCPPWHTGALRPEHQRHDIQHHPAS